MKTVYIYAVCEGVNGGEVVYVGRTTNLQHRRKHHRSHMPWFTDEHALTVLFEVEAARAISAERKMIRQYRPKHNVNGNLDEVVKFGEQHGRNSTYKNKGCRCEPCRVAANRVANARNRRMPSNYRLVSFAELRAKYEVESAAS